MTYLMKFPLALRCVGSVLLLFFSWGALKGQTLSRQSLNARSVADAAVFRTSSQIVLVPVTVTDRYGKTIEGLGAKDFAIQEDRVSQPIVSFGAEDAPCSVGLVLDVSGSMRSMLSGARGVTRSFIQTSNPGDEFLLLTVSTRPDSTDGFTTDAGDLERSIDRTSPGGMTALIDTVYLGLSRMRKANQPRRALLILSDGIDNHSRYSKTELLRVALEADVQIYTIIFDNGAADASTGTIPYRPALIRKPGDRAQEPEGPRMLEELSDKTGGLHFHVSSDAEAKEAAFKAGQALRNQYVIGYQPPLSGATGQWHKIRVKSNVPKVNVYARSGYYAP